MPFIVATYVYASSQGQCTMTEMNAKLNEETAQRFDRGAYFKGELYACKDMMVDHRTQQPALCSVCNWDYCISGQHV